MVNVQERLGFSSLAMRSSNDRERIFVGDLLIALAEVGITTLFPSRESGRYFHEALSDMHRHARVMVRRGDEWGLTKDQVAFFRSVSAVTAPSLTTGSYFYFWNAVFASRHTLSLSLACGGYVEVGFGQQLAQQYLDDRLWPDYAQLVRRYVRCIARYLAGR